MASETVFAIGALIVFLTILIFAVQRYSWARHSNRIQSIWPYISAGLSAIFFILTVTAGVWFPQYLTIAALALLASIAAPVFYNLYAVIKKSREL